MSQVNLLPPEIREALKSRRLAVLVGMAGAAVLALLILLYFVFSASVASVRQDIAAQESINADLEGRRAELLPFEDLQNRLDAVQTLIGTALQNEVAWSGILTDVQFALPGQMFLTSLTGDVSSEAAAEVVVGTPDTGVIGSLTFTGTSAGTSPLARWLGRLVEVRGWENSWLSTVTETAELSRIYDFTSSVDLTNDVLTERGRGAPKETGLGT
ncbi:MAG: hypothetical protein WD276_04940 [Actinomycetota bacterium]